MTQRLAIHPPDSEAQAMAYAGIFFQSLVGAPQAQPDFRERFLDRTGRENVRVATRRGEVLGGLAVLPLGQWFGGRSVRMAGVHGVAVAPEHRGSGVAGALMRASLEEGRAAGFPLSGLYPATQPVYRRAGFEIAGSRILYRLPTRGLPKREPGLEVRRLVDSDHPRVEAAYREHARRGSGLLDRSEWAWRRILGAPDRPVHSYLVLRGRRVEGYVAFVHVPTPTMGYELHVRDLVALTPAAARRLWALLGDHRSMAPQALVFGAPNDPLLHLLAEQDYEVETRWDWMLRLVDVPSALEARGYPPGLSATVHLRVVDDVLAANDGRWVLTVSDGTARVTRGGRGRVRAGVRGLASLYTGCLSAADLEITGEIEGPATDLAALSACFAGPAPWMPDMF